MVQRLKHRDTYKLSCLHRERSISKKRKIEIVLSGGLYNSNSSNFEIATCQSKDHRYLLHCPNLTEWIWNSTNTTAAWRTIKAAIFRLTNSAAVRLVGKMSLSPGHLRGARVTQLYNGSIIATKQAIRLALSLHLTSCQCVNRWTSTPQGWRSKNSPPDSGAGKELTALSMEEPITSSQLEGANTTTLVARDTLESSRSPVPKMNTWSLVMRGWWPKYQICSRNH